MRFRTEFNLPSSNIKIRHSDRIVLLGSCFTDSIGKLLKEHKFITRVNPRGILYHPLAIQNCIEDALLERSPDKVQAIKLDDRWVHYTSHSQIWGRSKDQLFARITASNSELKTDLRQAQYLFISLEHWCSYKVYNVSQ